MAHTPTGAVNVKRGGEIEVSIESGKVLVSAPKTPLFRLQLRWQVAMPAGARILGDAWERGYGDLEWRGVAPERVMPWYFLRHAGGVTTGYGVATGAAAMCCWQADAEGITLWLDLRSGGAPVQLGERQLHAATVIVRHGVAGESPFRAAGAFCRQLCAKPLLPASPVYGGNNWYSTYGRNCSAEAVLGESNFIAELSPGGANRPFMVIDDGWQPNGQVGPWLQGNTRFPDMPGLAARMKSAGVRPGIWIRPLVTKDAVPEGWLLKRPSQPSKYGWVLDPTVPEVRARVMEDVGRMAKWGFEMIKHDFTNFDLFGRWGFAMGAQLTDAGWSFSDRTRTTAEIVLDVYRAIRQAAGGSLLIGCNTIGHLSAGLVELQRTGDDTSGMDWNRTRRMGVNTLAFRMPQQGAFFACDADCVPLTKATPWEMNRQWLDVLARSGTPLFVSAAQEAVGPEQRKAIQTAFAQAARVQPAAEPLDWMNTTHPTRWRFGRDVVSYRWSGLEGPSPYAQ